MSASPHSVPSEPGYAWELATLFPEQGSWSEDEYLDLTDGTNRRIEFSDGCLEFLPMTTEVHQALVGFLYHALLDFVTKHQLGVVPFPPLRLRVRQGKIREPDILFLAQANFHLRTNRLWHGADLVMEVVSDDPKDRRRDFEEKVADYAAGNVAEYWIVDPMKRQVTIYQLQNGAYVIHGEHPIGSTAVSPSLVGFSIDVTKLFAVLENLPQ